MGARRMAARLWRYRFVALALLVVGLSYAGAHALAAEHADRLTLTVRSQPPGLDAAQTVIYTATLTEAGAVEAVQHAINNTPTLPLFTNINCPLGALPFYTYDVSFSWRGIVVEGAYLDTETGCMFWHMSILGLPELTHVDDGTALNTLRHFTGMPTVDSRFAPCL